MTSTIGLHLFTGGNIIKVVDGTESVVAAWPSRTAPYSPPIETRHGFVGLAQGPRRLDLWSVDSDRRERLASDVSQHFSVSAGARMVAYGLPVYRAGEYHTRLVVAALPHGGERFTTEVNGYGEAVGFIGERVLVGIDDDVALWDPSTGTIRSSTRYGSGGTTDPTARRAFLYQGDGMCWEIGNWADAFTNVLGSGCRLSEPAFSPRATWIGGINDPFTPRGRLRVYETFDAESYFRSSHIPGAFHVAWVDDYTALVTALCCDASFRDSPNRTAFVYRCRTDNVDMSDCSAVWSGAAKGRYAAWVIPRAPSSRAIRHDDGRGFAMWPEYRGADAREACADPPPWRRDPHTVAEEFGRQVLRWANARAEIDSYGHQATHGLLRRGDGPLVQVWLQRVGSDCWSVTGVRRRRDNRPEGVSASVRGREVQVGVLSLGAESAEVILGFNGREIRTTDQGAGATLRLDFKPRGSGFFLVLLRDESGEVFSASGALLYPGLVAG